ncbi:MAG: TonB-dependent receptor [Xylophilus ampelinus]
MLPSLRPLPLAIAAAIAAHGAAALAADPAPAAGAPTLAPVTVSASVLGAGSGEMSTPATVLEGDELVTRRAASLGETLENEEGIRSSHFGSGASRPIIRGMDGARVKVLSDGAEVQDASTVSPDHAVAVEPMLSQQIEVLRGPSALAYGGGAIGGVVNVLDNKIPTKRPARGVEGSAEVRANTGAGESAEALGLTADVGGGLVLHAEGLKRHAGDYRVGSGWEGGGRVPDSFNNTQTGSLGLSWVGQRGYLGAAYTDQRNRYGLPGHDESYDGCRAVGARLDCITGGGADAAPEERGPYVLLRSRRWDVRGELSDPLPGFAKARLRASATRYRHDEIDNGEIDTTFRNRARDGRLELEHYPVASWRGVVGLQLTRRDFSALGDDAIVAPSVTDRQGVYLVEEKRIGDLRLEAGLRHERQTIDIASDQGNTRHTGNSASVGAVWRFAPQYSVGASLSRTQRLPTAEELYSDGPHLATSTIERGDPSLRAETARNIDLTLRKTGGDTTFGASVFRNRIDNYIYARTLDAFQSLQLIQYAQRDATFTGFEGHVRQRLNSIAGVTLFGDYVQARLADGGGNLPRIPARRLGLRMDAAWQRWSGEAEVYRVAAQDRLAAFETRTPGYNMVNLTLGYSTRLGGLDTTFYARGTNLTDQLALNHSSFIKNAAPLMGRSLTVGARVAF